MTRTQFTRTHRSKCSEFVVPHPDISGIHVVRVGTSGDVALIDTKDVELVSEFPWWIKKGRNALYAITRKRGEKVLSMHCLIMNCPVGFEVDHKDGNGLNNRRENLRIATGDENRRNRGLNSTNRSGFKGVYFDHWNNRWRSHISFDKKMTHLGSFDSAEDAAKAYDEACRLLHGQFARLNFPD